MQKRIRNHIRSNIVGYVSLFFALTGGVAWATHPGGANTISSGDIINNEVQTADIRDANLTTADIRSGAVTTGKILDGEVRSIDVLDNSLNANDIDESTLPLVPSADVQAVDFRSTEGGGDGSILNLGGLNLAANCNDLGPGGGDLQWFYSSGVDNASLHVSFSQFGDPNAKTLVDDDVDTGVSTDPLPGSANDDDIAGTLVYTRPDGVSVGVDFQQEDSQAGAPQALGGSVDCLFTGVAVRAGP